MTTLRLKQPVADNAIHRPGHQPFTHTIEDVLNQLARRSVQDAFTRHDLEQRRDKNRNGMR